MNEELRKIINQRMERAKETLDESILLLENNHVRSSVSRLYYACFYSVSALMLLDGHYSSKHSGLIALFDRHWVAQGKIPKEMGRFYRRLYDRRQKSDYSDMAIFSSEDVKGWVEETRHFINIIEDTIKSNYQGQTLS